MTTMRRAVYDYRDDRAGVCVSEGAPKPPADRSGHVLVRVVAAGVNPVDAKFVAGDKFPECCMSFWKWNFTGYTPGFDWSGVIECVLCGRSKDTVPASTSTTHFTLSSSSHSSHPRSALAGSDLKRGDKVFGTNFQYPPQSLGSYTGTFAEFASVPVDQCWRMPRSLSFQEVRRLTSCQTELDLTLFTLC